ncbi:MAG: 23S rRNA (pseudouridine(1915)-N(3))-methyltransferase RlmH [Gammaproteobacteria bacterium]|nr:23S rRNA (pseudouridine(1915)-N(3))-methyltransferase RlmH [Gammaproteobacteria bacterium]MCI0590764.1 23S rRNA (pseudouridine(1915)-N(3))-methyltransferase RlmH [Gammaproteobacteria bacterium]
MRLCLIAVRKRMPGWVETGLREYARRLPAQCRLELVEVPPARRRKSSQLGRLIQEEAKRIQAAIPKGAKVIALDEAGEAWTSADLAQHMRRCMQGAFDVAFVVGGADGLDRNLKQGADYRWSLSRLTLPHGLVGILVAEQIYRAWTMLTHHPYHRS